MYLDPTDTPNKRKLRTQRHGLCKQIEEMFQPKNDPDAIDFNVDFDLEVKDCFLDLDWYNMMEHLDEDNLESGLFHRLIMCTWNMNSVRDDFCDYPVDPGQIRMLYGRLVELDKVNELYEEI